MPSAEGPIRVESECGAVAVGRAYLLPPLSSGGASLARPWLRFHTRSSHADYTGSSPHLDRRRGFPSQQQLGASAWDVRRPESEIALAVGDSDVNPGASFKLHGLAGLGALTRKEGLCSRWKLLKRPGTEQVVVPD